MISVVMASYLGNYSGAASNRDAKLRRAVDSFLLQDIGELIVVSDGCELTNQIVESYKNPHIKLIKMMKQPLFAGSIRQRGIKESTFDWICYLDSDDLYMPGYLQKVVDDLDDQYDWIYYNDLVGDRLRTTCIAPCRIGTSNIVHKKNTPAVWPDGYMHDWKFIQQLGGNCKKIEYAGYQVCHVPNQLDI